MNKNSSEESFLEREINAFMEQLPSMLKEHEEKYAVFKGDKCLGFWHCWNDALEEGYKRLGLVSFLIIKVSREYEFLGRYGKPMNIYSLSD